MAAKRKHPQHPKHHVKDVDIAALAKEAAHSGDHELVKVCGRALTGRAKDRALCGKVLLAARAMGHHHPPKA